MPYTNPVIPGFHPDPSVCRVGADYYLVTSSFEYYPGVPIFHSRDLFNWRPIGHCLTRESQLPLHGARSSGGIFAPTIRYHQGRFYMVTTNITARKHILVHAENPEGPWSEPVWLDMDGIDPSLLFDDDGKVYFSSTGPGGIWQSELDVERGTWIGEKRSLWAGTGGSFPEAPHLYRLGDTYYLLIAEGGTEYGHMVTIARSGTPWGPFEPCPHNPILSHRSKSLEIRCTGHGDLVQDHRGNWWMVFLGTRPVGYPPCYHLGRETFLAPVSWDANGWPVVNGGRPV
jgi:xylan 1,4-beta-xylosidase